MSGHLVQFYESDVFLRQEVARYIESGLRVGDTALVIATEPHCRALTAHLGDHSDRLVALDADELFGFGSGGGIDRKRFERLTGDALERAAGAGNGHVRAFGEMMPALANGARYEVALEVESLWTQLRREVPFDLVCAYPLAAFARAEDRAHFRSVCAAHMRVRPAEIPALPSGFEALDRRIAELQQQALALATEAARRRYLERADTRAEASSTERRRDEHLAMLAHELRNPLAPIVCSLELLRSQGSEPDEQARTRRAVEGQVEILARLTDGFLDTECANDRELALTQSYALLEDVVGRAVELARPSIQERRHRLRVELPPEPMLVFCDSMRLAQALGNVLHNAAQYTDGGAQIALSAEAEGGELRIRVRDDGAGGSTRLRERDYALFARGSRGANGRGFSPGVGLSLARSLVELHGGSLEAKSDRIGRGGELIARLPLRSVAAEIDARRNGGGSVPTRRVLIVDDEPKVGETIARVLRASGHEVNVVSDGFSAVAEVVRSRPDLVLLDIYMPGIDGFEVARRLRALPALPPIVLVALTGYSAGDAVRRAQQAGFDHFLPKPPDLARLRTLLRRGL